MNRRVDAVDIKADTIDTGVDLWSLHAGVTRSREARRDVRTALAGKRVAVDVDLAADGTTLAFADDALFRALPGYSITQCALLAWQPVAAFVSFLQEVEVVAYALFKLAIERHASRTGHAECVVR